MHRYHQQAMQQQFPQQQPQFPQQQAVPMGYYPQQQPQFPQQQAPMGYYPQQQQPPAPAQPGISPFQQADPTHPGMPDDSNGGGRATRKRAISVGQPAPATPEVTPEQTPIVLAVTVSGTPKLLTVDEDITYPPLLAASGHAITAKGIELEQDIDTTSDTLAVVNWNSEAVYYCAEEPAIFEVTSAPVPAVVKALAEDLANGVLYALDIDQQLTRIVNGILAGRYEKLSIDSCARDYSDLMDVLLRKRDDETEKLIAEAIGDHIGATEFVTSDDESDKHTLGVVRKNTTVFTHTTELSPRKTEILMGGDLSEFVGIAVDKGRQVQFVQISPGGVRAYTLVTHSDGKHYLA